MVRPGQGEERPLYAAGGGEEAAVGPEPVHECARQDSHGAFPSLPPSFPLLTPRRPLSPPSPSLLPPPTSASPVPLSSLPLPPFFTNAGPEITGSDQAGPLRAPTRRARSGCDPPCRRGGGQGRSAGEGCGGRSGIGVASLQDAVDYGSWDAGTRGRL